MPVPAVVRRLLVTSVVLVVAGGWTLVAAPAASAMPAHATLDGSVPAADELVSEAPDAVVLRFSEPVSPSAGGFGVLDPSGTRVDGAGRGGASGREDPAARWTIPVQITDRGTFTVTWRVISEDGHPIAGSSTFHVGRRSGAVGAAPASERLAGVLGWVGRVAVFGGLALLVAAIFLGPASSVDRRNRRVGAAGAVLVGAVLVALARADAASGRPPWAAFGAVARLAADTQVGRFDVARVVAAAALVVLAAVPAERAAGRLGRSALGVGVVVVAVTLAGAGHAATARWEALAVALDAVHLLAALTWVGVVAGLALTAPGGVAAAEAAPLVARASRVALGAAPVAVVSGVGLALVHVAGWRALVDSASGRVLVAKVAAVVGALALGALHRGRLATLAEDLARRSLTLRLEVGALVAALGLAAALVALPPPVPDASPPRPFSGAATTAAGVVHLDVTPGGVGDNRVVLHFATPEGADRPVDVVAVSLGRAGIPARSVAVRLRGRSLAEAGAVTFGAPGTWTVQVRAVYRGTSERATFRVVVP